MDLIKNTGPVTQTITEEYDVQATDTLVFASLTPAIAATSGSTTIVSDGATCNATAVEAGPDGNDLSVVFTVDGFGSNGVTVSVVGDVITATCGDGTETYGECVAAINSDPVAGLLVQVTTENSATVVGAGGTLNLNGGANISGYDINLPTATPALKGNSKKIVKTDSDETPLSTEFLTVTDGAGFSFNLCTEGESVEVVCDGSEWRAVSHNYDGSSKSWTPTGSWTTNVTYTGKKWRVKNRQHYAVKVALAGEPDNVNLSIDLPNWEGIKVSELINATNEENLIGTIRSIKDNGTDIFGRTNVWYKDGASVWAAYHDNTTFNVRHISKTAPVAVWANGDAIFLEWDVPIDNWESGV